jgi:predicted Rossmann fold flavoprotein
MEPSSTKTSFTFDVVVVGGGPAGMMAAGRAAERGLSVILIEKNDSLGKKLLITGGGRCNLTNAEFDDRALLAKFKDAGKFLFSSFAEWSVRESLDFFNSHGMPTKIDPSADGGQRVFPVSDKAQSVWDVLVNRLKTNKVTVISNCEVVGFTLAGDNANRAIKSIRLKKGEIRARSFILATGGMSRPDTGSTGDGFKWLQELGHSIAMPVPSLVPIKISDTWVKKLSGVSLPSVKISLYQNGVKQGGGKKSAQTGLPAGQAGKILFTHFGVSGPTILNMSSDIRELLKYGAVEISIDLLPAHDYSTLNTALQDLFKKESNKKFKNVLGALIPSSLVAIIVDKSGIDSNKFCNSVTRDERVNLVKLLKDVRMNVLGLLGVEKAIVTSGGVALNEVDWKTMKSRLIPNLHIVGDLLDIDRPSGGYSLQLCWTTGFVAGNAAGK